MKSFWSWSGCPGQRRQARAGQLPEVHQLHSALADLDERITDFLLRATRRQQHDDL
jgi:hypothetical protein